MYEQKELSNDMKDLLRNMNDCMIKLAQQQNLQYSLEKLDFLEKEGFYDDKPPHLFQDKKHK